MKEIYQQSVFEKGQISVGGGWSLAPGDREGDPMRGAAWNKSSTAGREASRELNCQAAQGR